MIFLLLKLINKIYVSIIRIVTIFNSKKTKKLLNDKLKISIVIPVINKDYWLLPSVISGLRENLDGIDEIIIVSTNNKEIKELATKLQLRFIDETSVLGINKDEIKYGDRNGWLFQQFIKLSSNKFAKNNLILVWDADTILLKKIKLMSDNTQFFYVSDEYHLEYFSFLKRIFPINYNRPFHSAISHFMLFNSKILTELQLYLESRYYSPWHKVILENCNKKNHSCFSEYETYFYFFKNICKFKYKLLYWSNAAIKKNPSFKLDFYIRNYKSKYDTISIHSYF